MNNKLLIIFVFLVIILVEFKYAFAYEMKSDGIVFKLKQQKETDPRLLKIQICSDEIIHVIASPVDSFLSRASLMVNKTNWEPVNWSIKEEGSIVKISTSKITVAVDSISGKIEFFDKDNNLLVNEKNGGEKIITPAEVMGEQTYHIQQLFKP